MSDREIGQRIREARLDKGFTQAALARYLHCHYRKIVRLEHGTQPLLLADAIILSEILEIDLMALAGRPAAKPSTSALIQARALLLDAATDIQRKLHADR